MQNAYPDYYPLFHCIADRCRHNCCIGWEIDVDGDSLAAYDQIGGEDGRSACINVSTAAARCRTFSSASRSAARF